MFRAAAFHHRGDPFLMSIFLSERESNARNPLINTF
jgi:hypothetical protein